MLLHQLVVFSHLLIQPIYCQTSLSIIPPPVRDAHIDMEDDNRVTVLPMCAAFATIWLERAICRFFLCQGARYQDVHLRIFSERESHRDAKKRYVCLKVQVEPVHNGMSHRSDYTKVCGEYQALEV
jgi:hypothetical protein